jgi:drug/metabolite transporter (DMT)-like permease
MSKILVGNLLLAGSLLLGVTAHVILKSLTNQIGPLQLDRRTLTVMSEPRHAFRAGAAIALLAAAFGFWILCLSRLPLSYAYPLACSSALLVTFLSAVILKEPITIRTWAATILITAGTMLLRP